MEDRQREQARLRKQRQRDRESVTSGSVTPDSVTPGSVTPDSVTQYPAIILALSDIKKRAKLRAICQQLHNKGLLKEVRYGVRGPTMDIVAELLTAF